MRRQSRSQAGVDELAAAWIESCCDIVSYVKRNAVDIAGYEPFPNTVYLEVDPPDAWDT